MKDSRGKKFPDAELLTGEAESGDCNICGADLEPSESYPWHYPDEDCRAVRYPL